VLSFNNGACVQVCYGYTYMYAELNV
jgi:hypothetical protein